MKGRTVLPKYHEPAKSEADVGGDETDATMAHRRFPRDSVRHNSGARPTGGANEARLTRLTFPVKLR